MQLKTGELYRVVQLTNSDFELINYMFPFIVAILVFIMGITVFWSDFKSAKGIFLHAFIGATAGILVFIFILNNGSNNSSDMVKIGEQEVSNENFHILVNKLNNDNYDYVYFLKYENDIVTKKQSNTYYTTAQRVNAKNLVNVIK